MENMKANIIVGRIDFHIVYISQSNRSRGNAPRVTIKNATIAILLIHSAPPPIKRRAVRNLRNSMNLYSAIKMNANIPPMYSVLNPETSSDSPSEKSNGARLDSARQEITQIINNGIAYNIE